MRHCYSVLSGCFDISFQSQYDEGTDTTRRQLLNSCPTLNTLGDEYIDGLLDVWKGVVHRIYHYYQLSATAYFKFLQLNGGVGDSILYALFGENL